MTFVYREFRWPPFSGVSAFLRQCVITGGPAWRDYSNCRG